jgi:hypothetical protein
MGVVEFNHFLDYFLSPISWAKKTLLEPSVGSGRYFSTARNIINHEHQTGHNFDTSLRFHQLML